MDFKYTTALHRIRQMKSRIKIVQGGSSSSKTYSILAILINDCIVKPGLSVSVIAESMPVLRRGALRDFLNILKATNRYKDDNYNRSNLIYTFTNGSYIEFFSADDSAKLRGARRNVLFLNEANNINEEAFNQLSIRTDGDIYIDFNPTNRFWAHDINGAEQIILTYKQNEALQQTVIDFLESKRTLALTNTYWVNWCRVYLDGQLGSLEGVVYSNWNEIDTIPAEAVLIGSGADWGFTNDPTTCVSVYKYNGKLIVDEVIYQKGLGNSEISALMKDNNIIGEIYGDSAEPKTISEIKNYGHRIYPVKKGPDSILAGIQILQEFELLITKRSTNLKKELENYSWKKDTDGTTLNIPIDAWNHCLDALRYLALMKLGKKRVEHQVYNEENFMLRTGTSY